MLRIQLSSTAIGATASTTASANAFTDFFKNGLGKIGEIVKSGVNMVFGNKISNKLVMSTVAVGLVCVLVYGTYRAIKAGISYYNTNNDLNANKNFYNINEIGNNNNISEEHLKKRIRKTT